MTRKPLRETRKPILNENSFQELLSAAYVLQQHSDRLIGNEPEANPTRILSEIVDIQRLIEAGNLDIQGTSKIIAERLKTITSATGVAISIVDGSELEYIVALGKASTVAGSRIPCAKSPSAESLRSVTASRDGQSVVKPLVRRIADGGSFISVPFSDSSKVAGAVELRFESSAVPENDIAAAQLMAGLMGDAVARSRDWRRHTSTNSEEVPVPGPLLHDFEQVFRAAESQFILEEQPEVENEHFHPHLANTPTNQQPPQAIANSSAPAMDPVCHSCGHHFVDDEYFCGSCGLTRFVAEIADDGLQSKWASMWFLQQSSQAEAGNTGSALHPVPKLNAGGNSSSFEALDSSSSESHFSALASAVLEKDQTSGGANPQAESTADLQSVGDNLGRVSSPNSYQLFGGWISQQWRRHRAEFYLVVAAILLLVAISGWGTNSSNTANSPIPAQAMRRQNPPKPKLTAFEQVLVSLGLAEPPPAPAYEGNPDTQVWIDLHTALYYCPGTDLYGATPKGRMTSQRSAQLDEFQPADRRPCD
ncbi:MAG: hypothetical protein NVS1B11_05110 [Terriglobales bacterium]